MDTLEKKPVRKKISRAKKNEILCNVNENGKDKEIKYSTEVRIQTRKSNSEPNILEKQTQEKTNSSKLRRLRKKRALERQMLEKLQNQHLHKLIEIKSENHNKKVKASKNKKVGISKLVEEKVEGVVNANNLVNISVPTTPAKNIKMEAKLEKSREEIVAEREAKKLAKLTAKNKKSNTQLVTPNKLEALPGVAAAMEGARRKSTDTGKNLHKVATSKSAQKQNRVPKNDAAAGDVKQQTEMEPLMMNEGDKQKAVTAKQVLVKTSKLDEKNVEDKTKADIRTERRIKQEVQRAAKIQATSALKEKVVQKPAEVTNTASNIPRQKASVSLPNAKKLTRRATEHKVKLFNHLYTEREENTVKVNLNSSEVHPGIIKLGAQYANGVVVGSNARCIALLNALKQVIKDYITPPQKEFSRGLEASLQPCMEYLHQCRPVSVSMTNALRYLKRQINQLENNISDVEAKHKLLETIDTYYDEQIHKAAEGISNTVQGKIVDGDVILTYGCSSLIEKILEDAHKKKKFRVVVVEGRPLSEGREMLRRLVGQGITCTFVLINAASFIMTEVTKVLLGAHALLANGYVMSRVGTAQVAMVAQSCNVPVLVCCETHKFIERVQTDSFVYNEIGDPNELLNANTLNKRKPLASWQKMDYLTLLNLKYDVTPPELVTAVVTELAILPCTSVPVILRIKPADF